METKHTPGPWTYEKDSCAQCENEGTAEFYIPEIECGYHSPFSKEADARLCAAAPDLLEALTLLVADHVDLVNSGDCGSWDPESQPIVKRARAAILKATHLPVATPAPKA